MFDGSFAIEKINKQNVIDMKVQLLSIMLAASGLVSFAQESISQVSDTLAPAVEQLQSDLMQMKKLSISGYVQAQAQLADSAGIKSMAGGNFDSGVNSRFGVRRGRLKFAYTGSNGLTQAVIQFDITEKQFATKDVYLKATDPFLNAFTVTGGVFNRPFGYEIEYSSSLRETPERSRIVQTLFPGERDMGFMLTVQAPKTSRYNFAKFDVGLFNGVGPKSADFDKHKDLISRLSCKKSFLQEQLKISGGVSGYYGGWNNVSDTLFTDVTLAESGVGVFTESKGANKGKQNKRMYYGADLQVTMDLPIGLTTLRGEYIQGDQPATQASNASLEAATTSKTYVRSFRGGYVYVVQNIGQTRFQLVGKLDYFDPNTKVSGNQIAETKVNGKTSALSLSTADIAYTTYGFGVNVKLSENMKVMAYYDIVKNEKTQISKHTKDLKDNVATVRFQYKF